MRMFFVGCVLDIGLGMMVAFTSQLSSNHGRNFHFAMFTVFLQAVPILGRILNAVFLIKIPHDQRLLSVCFLFVISFGILSVATFYSINEWSLGFALAACLLHTFAKSIGEATVVGYIKAIPQELVVSFSTGTGVSSFFQTFTTLILMEFGIGRFAYFLLIAVLIFPLYTCFMWIETQRL